jgi:hypothetical protein
MFDVEPQIFYSRSFLLISYSLFALSVVAQLHSSNQWQMSSFANEQHEGGAVKGTEKEEPRHGGKKDTVCMQVREGGSFGAQSLTNILILAAL